MPHEQQAADRRDRPGTRTTGRDAASPIRVLLVDDHRLFLDSLARLLEAVPEIAVACSSASVAGIGACGPGEVDVALVDYQLRDGTGIDAIRAVRARWPGARIVMLTGIEDEETLMATIRAGADGYLTKDRAAEDVVRTVRSAHAGATLLPEPVIAAIARRLAAPAPAAPPDQLTPRELEILRALVEGLSTHETCVRLGISPNTFRTHVQNLTGKLGVHSKLEAVAHALRHGLVEPPRGA